MVPDAHRSRTSRARRVAVALLLALLAPLGARASVRTVEIVVPPRDLAFRVEEGAARVSLAGAVPSAVPGEPDRPLLPVTVLPPAGERLAGFTVDEIAREAVLPPAPLIRRPGGGEAGAASALAAALVSRGPGGWMRGERVDGLAVSPLRPTADGGWELVTRLVLTLEFVPDETADRVVPLRGEAGVGRIDGRVLDLRGDVRPALLATEATAVATSGEAFSPRHRPSFDGSPVPFVIVTGAAMVGEMQRLADHRTRRGVPAVVRSMEWVLENYDDGVDDAENLRLFLRDAFRLWGTRGVLLAGDAPVVPIRYGQTAFFLGERIPTDLYFQCLDGNWNGNGNAEYGEGVRPAPALGDFADLYPELWVGRLPVNSVEDARVMVDRILAYERVEAGVSSEYPGSALLLAEVLFPQEWDGSPDILFDGATLAESTAVLLDPSFTVTKLYENHAPFAGAAPETLSTVIQEIDRGYGIVHHVGHGFYTNMAMGLGGKNLTIPDVDVLANGDRSFLLYAINCTSAAVDFDAIAEHFLTNPNGGAVGVVGSTRFDFPGTSEAYDQAFYRLIFREEHREIGRAATEAKIPFVPVAVADNAHRWTQFTLIYLGDPFLPLWTARPTPLAVALPASIPREEQSLALTVTDGGSPVEGARVTVSRAGETWASGLTAADGTVQLPVRPVSGGDLFVAATAPNRIAFEGSIPVGGGGLVVLDSVSVADPAPGGNGNGRAEAGEAVEITFHLGVGGSLAPAGVGVVVQPETTGVSVGVPVGSPPGVPGEWTFAATVDDDASDDLVWRATLAVTADGGLSWNLPATVPVGAPHLVIDHLVVTEVVGDGDGIPETGERVRVSPRLRNEGSGAARDLTGALSVTAGTAVVLDPTADYGALLPGEEADGPGFRVDLTGPLPAIRLGFTAGEAGGATRFSRVLDLVAPQAPVGPVPTGLPASVRVSWDPVADPDVVRYLVERADVEAGPYVRVSGHGEEASSTFEDGPLPPFEVRWYRVAAQDSSGNRSAFTPPVRGTTSLPLVGGFPLTTRIGTVTSPLVADLDGDGLDEVVVGGDQLYVFRGDGTEYIDGDRDARTLGVFSKVPETSGFWAPPAVGDLDGDGRLEVVAVTRNEGMLYVWDAAGRVRDGWPRKVGRPAGGSASTVFSAPTLLDLTGDGTREIVLHAYLSLWAFEDDGSEVRDGDDDPATTGIFFVTGSDFSFASPAGADLDGDGRDEIVVATRRGDLHVLDDDGSEFPGWPIRFGGQIVSSPALADLEGDEALEIVVATAADSLEVLRLDGSRVPGWPYAILMNQDIDPSPAVADVDGDDELDVVIVSGNTTVYLFHADGTLFPGFPRRFRDTVGNSMAARGSPMVADLDGDPELEIVFTNQEGWVFSVNPDASLTDGFPLKLSAAVEGGPLVWDLDGVPGNDLCIAGLDRNFYLWQSAAHVTVPGGWSMFQGNPRRTGAVTTPVREDLTPALRLAALQSGQVPDRATAYVVSTRVLGSAPALTLDGGALSPEAVEEGSFYRAPFDPGTGTRTLAASGTTVDGMPAAATLEFTTLAAGVAPDWETTASGVAVRGAHPVLLVRDGVEGSPVDPAGPRVRFHVGPPGLATDGDARVRFDLPADWLGAAVLRHDGSQWVEEPVVAVDAGRPVISPAAWGWFALVGRARTEVVAPAGLVLLGARPNPFRAESRIAFRLGGSERVTARVHDVRGAVVRTLTDTVFPSGEHELRWDGTRDDGRPVGAGMFFLRLEAGGEVRTAKLLRLEAGR